MTYEHRDNSGTLFTNKKKENDKHPDYRGEIKVDGKLWEISAWTKQGRNGDFLSLAVKEPYQKGQQKPQQSSKNDFDDEIGF